VDQKGDGAGYHGKSAAAEEMRAGHVSHLLNFRLTTKSIELNLLVLAKLAGERNQQGIAAWTGLYHARLSEALGHNHWSLITPTPPKIELDIHI